ncbi:hypothetical protein B0H66DRAFT_601575 [Apodospora peruviana]|uniref:DUF1917-domain-containing protein n=1 Tax=Apodospora peruviana TaxID=516989 RepID=A0AAE0M861_9PEZI|nr:hypothetical protein B0H66DRAFT_601575 [Apodospora peruviana]
MDSDSDFYGDEETVSDLKARLDDFDVEDWWKTRHLITDRISHDEPKAPSATGNHHNMFAGLVGAWQLSESIDDFLARLPPSTTERMAGVDWIRIANPFAAPLDRPALGTFREAGKERLQLLSAFADASNSSGKHRLLVKKEIQKEREDCVRDLRELAVVCRVLGGKWMLFPGPEEVDEVWSRVAHATAENKLGIVAKVEPRFLTEKARLICVYTKDFRDKGDIARVLNRLRQLHLVRACGKQIYYKCDAWTELDIYGGNDWGISASMHSSNEIFAHIKSQG